MKTKQFVSLSVVFSMLLVLTIGALPSIANMENDFSCQCDPADLEQVGGGPGLLAMCGGHTGIFDPEEDPGQTPAPEFCKGPCAACCEPGSVAWFICGRICFEKSGIDYMCLDQCCLENQLPFFITVFSETCQIDVYLMGCE